MTVRDHEVSLLATDVYSVDCERGCELLYNIISLVPLDVCVTSEILTVHKAVCWRIQTSILSHSTNLSHHLTTLNT